MTGRIARALVCLGLLTLLPGCVEMTQTITLNPDGRGKMKLDVVTAAFDTFDFAGMPGGGKKKTLDEIKRDAIAKFIKEVPGVTAFKDVSVRWTREGKLLMTATAYFDRLEDLEPPQNGPMQPGGTQPATTFRSSFKVKIENGAMRIIGKNEGLKEGVKPFDNGEGGDPTKMSDQELDEYLLRQRVEYQKMKPLLEMMLNDLKLTTVLHLPGDVTEAKGFKRDGKRSVSQTMEGAAMLAFFKKLMLVEAAEYRKLADPKNEREMKKLLGPLASLAEGTEVTIGTVGTQALFDYDAEVREARAAYPQLRKAIQLDEGVRLPGEQ